MRADRPTALARSPATASGRRSSGRGRTVLEAVGRGLRLRLRRGTSCSSAGPASTRYGVAIRPTRIWRPAPRRRGLPRRRRRPEVGRPERAGPARAGALRAARRPRPVRQPAAGHGPAGARGRLAAPAGAARRRRPADRARADRRALLRQAVRGSRGRPAGERAAIDTLHLHRGARSAASSGSAFELARGRRTKLTSVDKANVLAIVAACGGKVVEEVRPEYPDVSRRASAGRRLRDDARQRPAAFDVLVTENLFGDILSDEASRPGRLARDAAVGLARRAADGARAARPVRADPRLARRTSPARTWPTRSARSCPARCCCAGRSASTTAADGDRGGRERGARRRLPDGGPVPVWPGAAGDAVGPDPRSARRR